MGLKTLTFHIIAFAHHAYTLKFLLFNIDYTKTTDLRVIEMEKFGPRYLTSWNLAIQTIYLLLSILLDLEKMLPEEKKNQKLMSNLKTYTGYLYTVILFPTTMFVACMFWSLFWINREWVLPEAVEEVVPFWLNHSLHTSILIVVLLETYLKKRDLPKPAFKTAVFILTVFGIIYFVQFLLAYYQFGRWIYGLYYDLTWPQRFMMMLFTQIMSLGFLWVGYSIQNWKKLKTKTV